MNRKAIITVFTILLAGMLQTSYGQDRKFIRKGNELYEEQKYKEAVNYYQQALKENPTSVTGMFNLGNAYYKQKQTDAARQAMTATIRQSQDSLQRAAAQYNLGNTYMDEQKWEEAIEAYKQTLRNNPHDDEARYNLSYARAMLKQQQDGGDDNEDQQDDKKDNQQQEQNQDQQDQEQPDQQQDQDNEQQQKEEEQEQQRPQPMPSKLTEQQAEQILNALQQEEKNLQDKQQKEKGAPVKIEKDW